MKSSSGQQPISGPPPIPQPASKQPIPLQPPGISAMPPQLQLQLQLQLQQLELLKKTIEEQGLVLQKQKQLKPLTNDYIQIAGQLGIANLISYFEKNKMPTDQSDCFGRTLLHCAVNYNDPESVNFLLAKHVFSHDYVNRRDMNGLTALHYAAKHGNIEAVNALLQAERVNPDAYDSQGMTPLHYASYNARFEVVEALNASYKAKGKEIDVNKTGNGEEGSLSGKKPMELATLSTSSDYEKIRIMALLYKYGGKIEGEEFFINLDGNERISKDLNENIRKLNAQDQKSFSVNDFMIDVEAREKLKKI